MVVVVVREERFAKGPGVLNRPEVLGERRTIFEGLERGFAMGLPLDRGGFGLRGECRFGVEFLVADR